MRNRHGYTLIELMVGLVILGLVTGGIYKMLVTTQRVSRTQAERVDLQSNMRAAGLVVPSELRELNAVVGGTVDQNDIISMNANTIQYRAMRGIGYVCQVDALGIRIWNAPNDVTVPNTWSGLRAPQLGRDAAYVFIENNSNLNTDDAWQRVAITGVAGSTCGAKAAYSLTIVPALTAAAVPIGTPVRIFEVMELSLYAAPDGKSWLGVRSVSAGEATAQPLLGPLDAATGFGLTYYDANGAVTAVPSNVKSIRVAVKGLTYDNVARYGTSSTMGQANQSDTTQITLRNAFRP